MSKKMLPWTFFVSTFSLQAFGQLAEVQDRSAPPLRIGVKHIEGKGIGYTEGYSSIEGFFAPNLEGDFSPFLDARIHVFNNGLPAANGGLGLRYLSTRALGINAYYDFRKTKHKNYNGVSIGLESLGPIWDFRVNGYLPIFGKGSSSFDPEFAFFSGHSMILSQKKEVSFKSIEGEIATWAIKVRRTPAYLATGPYYLNGKGGSAFGGKGRFSFTFFRYFSAEAIASYDTFFKGIIQGRVSLNIPLGPTKKNPSQETFIKTSYAYQRVDRNEIIPTEVKRFEDTVAVNPTTGNPYVFWFVDNTSHSNGTYESPYPTVAQAEGGSKENEIIYIFPGDGTDLGLDTGFIMKKGQRLFGSGISQTVPIECNRSVLNITIPAQTATFPLLTLSASTGYNTGIITLNDNCEVAGLYIKSDSNLLGNKLAAIIGGPATQSVSTFTGVKNVYIHNNVIEGEYYEGGIYLHNSNENLFISENTLSNVQALNAICCINDISDISLSSTISRNTISLPSGGAIYFQNTSGTTGLNQTVVISGNLISNPMQDGIYIANNGDTLPSSITKQLIQITENSLMETGENGIMIVNNGTLSIENQKAIIRGNTVSGCLNGRGIYFFNNGIDMTLASQNIEIANSAVEDSALEGIYLLNYNEVTIGVQKTLIIENTVNNSFTTGICFANDLAVTFETQIGVIEENTVTTPSNSGIYLQNEGPSTNNPACFFIRNNTVDNPTQFGIEINTFSTSRTNVLFYDNLIKNSAKSITLTSNNTSTLCSTLINNQLDNDLVLSQNDTSLLKLTPLINNVFNNIVGTYTPVPEKSCECD